LEDVHDGGEDRALSASHQDGVVASAIPGQYVIFAADRVELLQGVPEGTSVEPGALRALAHGHQVLLLNDLMDLRVVADLRGPSRLLVWHAERRALRVPLRAQDVNAVQQLVDAVDTRVGAKARHPHRHYAVIIVLWTHTLLPVALLRPVISIATLIPAALLLFGARTPRLMAYSGSQIAAGTLAIWLLLQQQEWKASHLLLSFLAIILGGCALFVERIRGRTRPVEKAGLLGTVIVLGLGVVFIATSFAGATVSGAPALRSIQIVTENPGLTPLIAGLTAVTALYARKLALRLSFVGVGVLVGSARSHASPTPSPSVSC
jgi:hypothetical protein